jgi:hypothetical protein
MIMLAMAHTDVSVTFSYFLKQSRQRRAFPGGGQASTMSSIPQEAQTALNDFLAARLFGLLRGTYLLLLAIYTPVSELSSTPSRHASFQPAIAQEETPGFIYLPGV